MLTNFHIGLYMFFLKGSVIHCTAKSSVAPLFINKLQEGCIYQLKKFLVLPNLINFQIIRDVPNMIELDESTTVKQVERELDEFRRYPFQFTEFEDLHPTNQTYLIGKTFINVFSAS